MATELNLVVIYCADMERSKHIYETMGLVFTAEKHGAGPEHFSATLNGTVFEIYPGKHQLDSGRNARLGFRFDRVDDVFARLMELKIDVITPLHDSPWGQRAVVRDPDGYIIELSTSH